MAQSGRSRPEPFEVEGSQQTRKKREQMSFLVDIDELETRPQRLGIKERLSRADPVTPPPDAPTVEAPFFVPGSMASTAFTGGQSDRARGNGAKSLRYARPVAFAREREVHASPLDNLRWWLIRPGHIEFLLWFAGTILLIGITALLMFTLAVNLNRPAARTAQVSQAPTTAATSVPACATPATSAADNACNMPASSAANLKVTLLDGASLKVGSSLRLHGQGFSPGGQVTFMHDANLPCQPATARADGRGEFSLALLLGNGPGWQPGSHQIVVSDVASQRTLILVVTLVVAPAATPTPIPAPSDTTSSGSDQPGTTPASPPTVNQGQPVSASPTAVSTKPAPAPTKPAPQPTVVSVNPTHPPTSAPIKPTPTPGPRPKPTPTPTPTATATATPTPTGDSASPTADPAGVIPTPTEQIPTS